MKIRLFFPIFLSLFVGVLDAASFIQDSKNIAIIGTGYVGLITGAGLAEIGHNVTCADIDKEKIECLKNGKMPIFEPGLEDLVQKNFSDGRLHFVHDVGKAIAESQIVIIAVGTPTRKKGADLSALNAVVETIADHLNEYKIICIKSTVPVGTNQYVKSLLTDRVGAHVDFDVVSNPEFLRAGCAIKDFFERTPIVLGSDSGYAMHVVENMYSPLIASGADLIKTNFVTAEFIKYAWNAFSATRIAYVNEISNFCSAVGADVETVVRGMSFSEKLLPSRCLRPGPGIGGSCLPKDTQACVTMAAKEGVDLSIIRSVIRSNQKQKIKVVEYLNNFFENDLFGKKVAVLGLSFKPNTDDIRNSPAIEVLRSLLELGANVKAYDPQAMENMKRIIPEAVYCQSVQEAVDRVDAVVLLTDWKDFKSLDLDIFESSDVQPVIIDGRNMWNPGELKRRGFAFVNMGRQI